MLNHKSTRSARLFWLGALLGVTQAVNAPQGVSVAYTDSIPLLAVLCRPLAAALGGTFQYFGWFTLVCFALHGGFAALLCGLFAEGLAAPFAGSLVFAASPILLERAFRHTSLGAPVSYTHLTLPTN